MGTELDFNFDYDKAKQRQIRAKRNQTGSTGSSGSGLTTSQVNSLIDSALQDYEEAHPIPDPVTPNTLFAGSIEDNPLSELELRTLVWHDEFNNGQFDSKLWHKVTYTTPTTYSEGYVTEPTEEGVYLKEKQFSTVGRLVSRQAFRNCTIKIRAKRLSFWLGTMMFDRDTIPTDDEVFYQEIDFCEKYNQNNNNVYCNTHSHTLDTTNNKALMSSTATAVTGHNFYADDDWHEMIIAISAPNPTNGAISVIWNIDGTTVKTGTIARQNLTSNNALDQTIARQGIKIVLDKAIGEPYNAVYEMPVIDYVRVFSNESTAYKDAIELGYINMDGSLAPLAKGSGLLEFLNVDTVQEVPSAMLDSLGTMGLDEAHIALAKAIHSGEVYSIGNNKKEAGTFCNPPRLVALPLEAPVVPEFKYVDVDVVYAKNDKAVLTDYKFMGGDIRIIDPGWNLNSYDIKKLIFSWGGDFYKIFAVRSFINKLKHQADWTEADTTADSYIANKPS